MMEGISSEAASLAGHCKLANLCWIYDNNHITIEGKTSLAFSEDVGAASWPMAGTSPTSTTPTIWSRSNGAFDVFQETARSAHADHRRRATSATARRTSRTPRRPTANRSAKKKSS